jgi:hypothetical protein
LLFPRYALTDVIAKGTTAVVYTAIEPNEPKSNKIFAIKAMKQFRRDLTVSK